MKKVLTMTLNPCIDRTVYFEQFQIGATNIVKKVIEEAAGKGINVSVGLQHLQVPVKALGFAYRNDLGKLYGKLDEEHIPYAFVEVDGRLRVNQKLFDESKSEMTECNEKGCAVTKADVDALLTLLQEELQDAAILVLSGSVPPGIEKNIYAVMTTMAKKAGVKVVLDASGDLLREGVKAAPYLIKPNREEFEKTFMAEAAGECGYVKKTVTEDDAQIEIIAEELLNHGVSYICLSMGGDGAMMMSREEETAKEGTVSVETKILPSTFLQIEKRPAISVPIRSLQGAGDAMVAGLCKAIYEEQKDKMLDYAMEMAASTIMLEGTQMGYGVKEEVPSI